MNRINIAGLDIPLKERSRSSLKGAIVLDLISFRFYDFQFQGSPMLLLECKDDKFTPAQLKKCSERLGPVFNLPIVFYFSRLPYFFRKRLLEKHVYFVSGEKNAFLPSFIASPATSKPVPKRLSACAQYLLLKHLQDETGGNISISGWTNRGPYSYVSVAKAIQNLEALGLCRSSRDSDGNKVLGFVSSGKELWDLSKPFLSSPVKERFFCSSLPTGTFPTAGISALARYSHLSPDPEQTVAVYAKEYVPNQFEGKNGFDGSYIVEIWRYPSVNPDSVDRLSLYLSLENDPDPRVQKELGLMLDNLWKK